MPGKKLTVADPMQGDSLRHLLWGLLMSQPEEKKQHRRKRQERSQASITFRFPLPDKSKLLLMMDAQHSARRKQKPDEEALLCEVRQQDYFR